jgi:hypothetical protein
MTDPLQRRNFIKSIALTGASITLVDSISAMPLFPANGDNEIRNSYFTVSFDTKNGVINIYRANGPALLTGGTFCVNFDTGKLFISPANYKYAVTSKAFTDKLGQGRRLVIVSKSRNKKADVEIQVSLYDSEPAVTVEIICKNVSNQDILIKTIEPLRLVKNEGGELNLPGTSKCVTNGEMYYDTGILHEFGNKNNAITSGNIKGVKLSNEPIPSPHETIHSWWNAGFFSGYDQEGLVIGYLDNTKCLGNLLISKTGTDQISVITESAYAPEITLKPGKSISSNRVMITLAEDPYTALEAYASAAGKFNNARTHAIVNGWCSWFYTLAQVSEKEVIANTVFAEKHLKQLGLNYIQIDEGYQRWHGDWEGNERFPHGMKWLANEIKSRGLKPGIWISPYVISEPTEVFKNHPEWLLKNPDGSLQRIGNWGENDPPPADENPKRYCLDITHPGAANWLHDLIQTIAGDWGYEMIKIDFVAWSILAAKQYYNPTLSAAEVYREGMAIMRKAAGDKCHILECGPGNTTVGLVDSMRIELDANYGFADTAWLTYFTDPACSMAAAARRYYFHKRTWVNDADHICLDLLNTQQSEAAVSIIALSGGNMMSGDRLTQLDPHKLDLLKKVTPSFGEAARPVDLFDSDTPSAFALNVKKTFGKWTVVGLFNASLTETVERAFPLKRLWLVPGKTYLAFDFWKQQFIGEIKNEIKVNVQPGSVTLLALHEKTGQPQLISTDRHVLQGAIELETVNWNEMTKTLSGISTGALHTSYNLFIYLPEEHPWTWGGSALYRDYDSYSLKLIDKHIIRMHVHFEKAEKVHWQIKHDDFK